MNQFKKNLWVVSILFLSLMSSVALSYAITPTPTIKVKIEDTPIKLTVVGVNEPILNKAKTISLPQVVE